MGVLEVGDNLIDSVTPGIMVGSKSRLLVMANVADFEELHQGVLVVFLWCTSVLVATGEFTIPDCLGHAMIRHSKDVSCPT